MRTSERDDMAVKICITGPVGSIKAEALSRIIEMLQKDGLTVQGVLVSEVVENNKLVGGYSIFDISSKKRAVFAQSGIVSRVKLDKLGVDTRVLEEILIPSLQKARENADVIVIDEVGKLENLTKSVQKEIGETLRTEKPIIVTLHKKSRNRCCRRSGAWRA